MYRTIFFCNGENIRNRSQDLQGNSKRERSLIEQLRERSARCLSLLGEELAFHTGLAQIIKTHKV